MTDIRVPTLGESVSEATIGKWFKKPGDAVKADEPLCELETDKVTLEVNAPTSGVLAEITAKDGETVTPGAILGQITEGAAGAAAPKRAEAPAKAAPATKPVGDTPSAGSGTGTVNVGTAMPPAPSAAKMAAERGIDVAGVAGSGKRGQVLKGDVLNAPATAPQALPPSAKRLPRPHARRAHPTTRHAKSACA